MKSLISIDSSRDGLLHIFMLPPSFVLGEHLRISTPETLASALNIAEEYLKRHDILSNTLISDDINGKVQKAFDEEKELQKTQLTQQFKKETSRLELMYEQQKKESLKHIQELELLVDSSRVSQDILRKQFLDETERRIQQKESDLHLLIQQLRADIDRERAEKKELSLQLTAKHHINSNSSKKGKEGELRFQALAFERKGWALLDTSKEGHSGDFTLPIYTMNTRFEIKEYTAIVPGKEAEKFRRDLREHPETSMGVFVSMNTSITSIHGLTIEWTPKHQLILFIPNFLQYDMDTIFQFIDLLFQAMKPYYTLLSKETTQNQYPELKERIDRCLLLIQNGIKHISESMMILETDRRALQDRMDTMHSNMRRSLIIQKEELSTIVSILTDHIESIDEPIKEEKPKKRRSVKKKDTVDEEHNEEK